MAQFKICCKDKTISDLLSVLSLAAARKNNCPSIVIRCGSDGYANYDWNAYIYNHIFII